MHVLRFHLPIVLWLLVLFGCTESDERPVDEVVARVGDFEIRASELAAALETDLRDRPVAEGEPPFSAADRERVLYDLIDRKLLLDAAERHGIRVRPELVQLEIERVRLGYPDEVFDAMVTSKKVDLSGLEETLRQQLVIESLFEREIFARIAITDDEVEAWLEENAESLQRPERVRAAQIVVKTESEAEEILVQLRRGASFEELAKEHSLSPDAKDGGDLGWFARGEMPPDFEEVCFQLRPGRISGVIESPYGFHVFRVSERSEAHLPGQEEMREEAEFRLRREKEAAAQEAFRDELRRAAGVQVDADALARVVVKS